MSEVHGGDGEGAHAKAIGLQEVRAEHAASVREGCGEGIGGAGSPLRDGASPVRLCASS